VLSGNGNTEAGNNVIEYVYPHRFYIPIYIAKWEIYRLSNDVKVYWIKKFVGD